MSVRRALLAATALLAVSATAVAADHGYWPEAGVTPARVTGHEEATADTTMASYWGPRCHTAEIGWNVDGGALDVYGALLGDDYALAVIGGAQPGAYTDPGFLDGPYGLTLFGSPKKGQFVWADADGDGRFANRHEADSTLLILCPALPATDTVAQLDRTDEAPRRPSTVFAVVMATAVVLVVPLIRHAGGRRGRGS